MSGPDIRFWSIVGAIIIALAIIMLMIAASGYFEDMP